MGPAIIGFLKALPELVGVIKQLGSAIETLQNSQTTKEIEKLKGQVNVYTKQIENASTNEERRKLARELNRIVSS